MTTRDEAARLQALAGYFDIQPQTRRDLEALCEIAATVCDVPTAGVNLIDDRNQYEVAAYGGDPSICSREESMCAVTLEHDDDVVVADASKDPRYAGNPWVDGRLGSVRFYAASLLRSPAGHVLGTLCVYDDVPREFSPHRRSVLAKVARQAADVLELQLQTTRLADTVLELERSQGQLAAFAGQISHDLKTPLTATIGFAELLEELPVVTTDATASDYVQRCSSSARRMLAMIEAMLAYAQVGGTLQRASVELDVLVPGVLADLGPAAAHASVTWSGSPVPGDPVQLRALLQNLIGNALNYRRPEVAATVTVRCVPVTGGVELAVIDNGTTIAPEQRQQALSALGRLRRDVPGSGLGLATCVRIAQAHHGSLGLGETPGGGTTVTVNLPG